MKYWPQKPNKKAKIQVVTAFHPLQNQTTKELETENPPDVPAADSGTSQRVQVQPQAAAEPVVTSDITNTENSNGASGRNCWAT